MADYGSIISTPPQAGPMDVAGKYLGLMQGLNQNQLFQLNLQARQALGPILQGAVDPQTGELDYNKAFIGMAANPKTAWMAPDFLDKAITRQKTQMDIANIQLEMNIKKLGAIGDAAASLIPKGTTVTPQDVIGSVGQLLATDVIDKKQALAFITQMPQNGPDLYKYLQQQALRTLGAKDSLEKVYGSIQQVSAGGKTEVRAVSPMMEKNELLGTTEHVPTPAEASALVERVRPDGSVEKVPRAEAAPMYTGTGGKVEAQPQPQAEAPAVGIPPSGTAANAPTRAPLISSLSPLQKSQQEELGRKLGEYENSVNDNVSTTRSLMMTIEEARNALKEFKAGGGTATYANLARAAQAMGMPQAQVDKIAGGNLAAAQEFDKLAVGLATQQMKTMFQGSASKWAQMEWQRFQDANPNLETDPRAIERVYNFLTKVGKISYLEQDYLQRWKEEHHGDIAGFRPWFEKRLRDSGVVKLENVTGQAKGAK